MLPLQRLPQGHLCRRTRHCEWGMRLLLRCGRSCLECVPQCVHLLGCSLGWAPTGPGGATPSAVAAPWAPLAATSSTCTASCWTRECALLIGPHSVPLCTCSCSGCVGRQPGAHGHTLCLTTRSVWFCREFAGVSAHVDTIVKERKDKVTGKPRAATADDYASVSFKLQPRRSAEAGPLWGGTAGDGSGNGSGSIVVSILDLEHFVTMRHSQAAARPATRRG